jgi:ABC-type transport system substrate-binding protein
MKNIGVFSLALAALLCLTVCSGSKSADKPGAGNSSGTASEYREVTFALSTASFDLSPFGGDSGSRHIIRHQLYAFLFSAPDLGASIEELQGEVAKSIKMISPDTCEVEIYNYVKDSKGNPINAHDVVWCYEYGKLQGDFDMVNSNLKSIRAIDDYRVEIVANGIGAGVMQTILTYIPIVNKAWFEAAGASERTGDPACTGAYRIKSFVSGSSVVLEKIENFWQTDVSLRSYTAQQPLNTINYAVITEGAQRTIALENKEVDVAPVTATEVYRFQNSDGSNKPEWTVLANDNGRYYVMMFNCDEKAGSVFADQKMRQAVLYAIDFEAVRLGYGNTPASGRTMHDFCSPSASDYNPKWDTENYYDYNVDKAKELMAEAGYKPGQLKIRLMNQNSSTGNAGMAVIQAQLAQIGIEVDILSYDQALFNTYKFDSKQWDIIVDSKFTRGFVVDAWALCFDSRGFQNGTANFVHDSKFQEMLITAMEVHDAASIEAYHAYLKEKAYGVGMFYNYAYFVAQSGIRKIETDGTRNVALNASTYADNYKTVVE